MICSSVAITGKNQKPQIPEHLREETGTPNYQGRYTLIQLLWHVLKNLTRKLTYDKANSSDTELSTFIVAKGGNGPNSPQPMDGQTTYGVYIRQNAVTVLEHDRNLRSYARTKKPHVKVHFLFNFICVK